jgi:hypothetical protein
VGELLNWDIWEIGMSEKTLGSGNGVSLSMGALRGELEGRAFLLGTLMGT